MPSCALASRFGWRTLCPVDLGLADGLSTIVQLGPLVGLGVLYARRGRTLAANGQAVPGWRQWCFYGGLLTIAAALAGLGLG